MKHVVRALVALAVIGCNSSEQKPPANPTATVPAQPPVETTVTPPPSTPTTSTPTPAPVASAEPLPPPKPTTIPLAKTGDAALDAILAEADKAFEAGDLPKALAGYEAAKKSAPKRAAPIVGVA